MDRVIRTTPLAPAQACPNCQHAIEAVTGTAEPRTGDITLCIYCGAFLMVTVPGQQRLLTDGEWLALPAEYRALLTRLRDNFRSWFEARDAD